MGVVVAPAYGGVETPCVLADGLLKQGSGGFPSCAFAEVFPVAKIAEAFPKIMKLSRYKRYHCKNYTNAERY